VTVTVTVTVHLHHLIALMHSTRSHQAYRFY